MSSQTATRAQADPPVVPGNPPGLSITEIRDILDMFGFTIDPTTTESAASGIAQNGLLLIVKKVADGNAQLNVSDTDDNELYVFKDRACYCTVKCNQHDITKYARLLSQIPMEKLARFKV